MVKDTSGKRIGSGEGGYDVVLAEVVNLLEEARRSAARSVNVIMTATYWEIGRRVVECEQGGSDRAEYGKQIIKRLSLDLTRQFGRGFSRQNLQQMRAFYIAYADKQICQTPYGILEKTNDVQIQQAASVELNLEILGRDSCFPGLTT